MSVLDHKQYEKYFNFITYYDVGAFPDLVYPFSPKYELIQRHSHAKEMIDGKKHLVDIIINDWENKGNNIFLKKYVGIDPYFEKDSKDSKSIFYKCVVSDAECEKTFYIISPSCSSALYPFDDEERKRIAGKKAGSSVGETKVRCRKLSNIINENGGDIDLLKIDAHGSEYVILNDVKKYMKDIAAIHIEMWTAQWYKDAILFDKSHEFLTQHFFSPVYVVDPFQGISVDLLYVNQNHVDKNKIDFIHAAYGVNEKTISDAIKEVETQLGYAREGNFDYNEWNKTHSTYLPKKNKKNRIH